MNIAALSKEKCCGCELCSYICPVHAIKIIQDEEGFLYPEVKNNLCIDCGKCERECPSINATDTNSDFIDYLAGSCLEDMETISCSSGGLASAISTSFIKQDGVVYGVKYTEDFNSAHYTRVDQLNDLENLKGSKYIQAKKGEIYQYLEKDLKMNKRCLFIGLPCEVAAVKRHFKNYLNLLYTVELICHGPTSSLVQKKYVNLLTNKYSDEIEFFTVRYKKNGNWKPYYILANFKNGSKWSEKFLSSIYGTAFEFFKRPSCNQCIIKENHLLGDLMIGDYHYSAPGRTAYNPHGVSVALPHNEKGTVLLQNVNTTFNLINVDKHSALMNKAIHTATPKKILRNRYSRLIRKKGLVEAHEDFFIQISIKGKQVKYSCIGALVKIKRKIKR